MKAGAIFIGSLLIFLGVFFLLINFDVDMPTFEGIIKYWPLLLIIWGIALLKVHNVAKVILASLSGILLALIIASIYITAINSFKNIKIDESIDLDTSLTISENNYEDPVDADIKYAELDFSGGIGKFNFEISNDFGFVVKAISPGIDINKSIQDSTVKYVFSGSDIGMGESSRSINILLGKSYVWDIDISTGASESDINLKGLLLRNLNIDAGASDFKIEIGDLFDSNIGINSGAANFKITIPKNVGCMIKTKTSLSSTKFKDFISSEPGVFYSDDYDDWDRKINITIDGALSNFEVKRNSR